MTHGIRRMMFPSFGVMFLAAAAALAWSPAATAEPDPPSKPNCCCIPPAEVAPSHAGCNTTSCIEPPALPSCGMVQDGTVVSAKCHVEEGSVCARTYANVTPKKWNCVPENCNITKPDGTIVVGSRCKWQQGSEDGLPIQKLTCPDPEQECFITSGDPCPGT